MQAFLAAKTEQNWMVNKHLEHAKTTTMTLLAYGTHTFLIVLSDSLFDRDFRSPEVLVEPTN